MSDGMDPRQHFDMSGYPGESQPARICNRCERLSTPGGVWLTVEQEGAYPKQWEFCSIECLGSWFEANPEAGSDPREGRGARV
jgi:hypothetical protein